MKKKIINQVEAIALLKDQKSISEYKVEFDSTQVEVKEAFLLRKNGIWIPDELVWYDDDSIDYSDNPAWTDEELKRARLIRMIHTVLPLEDEVRTWIREEHIDFIGLFTNLITDFYHNAQFVSKSKTKSPPKKRKKKQVS